MCDVVTRYLYVCDVVTQYLIKCRLPAKKIATSVSELPTICEIARVQVVESNLGKTQVFL